MSERSTQMRQWLNQLGYRNYVLKSASEDASFRSYWRLKTDVGSLIVMDAPPQQESCDSFIEIAGRLALQGLNAPQVIAQEIKLGFLLLTDLGSRDFLSQFNPDSASELHDQAIAALLQMQLKVDPKGLPLYDELLLDRELELFPQWVLGELLEIHFDQQQQSRWQLIKQNLIKHALQQPQVFVHRDYHSRNLMFDDSGRPGILDFQDAVKGPITYDLVSLLRDCYIAWPVERVEQHLRQFHQAVLDHRLTDADLSQFTRWFNLMGLQRHLKALGIFSRLKVRDAKPGYLKDMPRTLDYIIEVCAIEPSMSDLAALIDELELGQRLKSIAESS